MQFSFQRLNIYFSFLHKATKTSGLRPMEQKDTKAVQELINTYLKQFNLAPVMDEEEVAHWFLPREHIIDTFVVEVKHSPTTSRICTWMQRVKNCYWHQVFWNAVEIWCCDSKFCSSYCILIVRKCLFECDKLQHSHDFFKEEFWNLKISLFWKYYIEEPYTKGQKQPSHTLCASLIPVTSLAKWQ